jgi:hypothetical protein
VSSYSVNSVSLDSVGTELTLTLNKDLYPNASYDRVNQNARLWVKTDIPGVVQATVATQQAIDGIESKHLALYLNSDSAYTQKVEHAGTTRNGLVLVFDEFVKPDAGDWDNVFNTLVIDGKTVFNDKSLTGSVDAVSWDVIGPASTTVSTDDASYAVYIVFRTGKIDAKDVKVQYGNVPGKQIEDAAGNTMGYFEETINFRVLDLSKAR